MATCAASSLQTCYARQTPLRKLLLLAPLLVLVLFGAWLWSAPAPTIASLADPPPVAAPPEERFALDAAPRPAPTVVRPPAPAIESAPALVGPATSVPATGGLSAGGLPAGVPAQVTPHQEPRPSDPGLSWGTAVRTLASIAVVLGLIVVCARVLKRVSAGGGRQPLTGRTIRVLETTHLPSPSGRGRSAIHVMEVGERVLLIGATDTQLTVLAELDGPQASGLSLAAVVPGGAVSAEGAFADALASAGRGSPAPAPVARELDREVASTAEAGAARAAEAEAAEAEAGAAQAAEAQAAEAEAAVWPVVLAPEAAPAAEEEDAPPPTVLPLTVAPVEAAPPVAAPLMARARMAAPPIAESLMAEPPAPAPLAVVPPAVPPVPTVAAPVTAAPGARGRVAAAAYRHGAARRGGRDQARDATPDLRAVPGAGTPSAGDAPRAGSNPPAGDHNGDGTSVDWSEMNEMLKRLSEIERRYRDSRVIKKAA